MARFESFTDCDINNLMFNEYSQNMKKQIEKQYNVFMAYCKEKALTLRPRNGVAMLSLIHVHLTLLRYKINFINFLCYGG